MNEKYLAVARYVGSLLIRPFGIPFGHSEKSFPSGKLRYIRTCCIGKTIESGFVNKHNFSRFCERKHDKAVINYSFFYEFGDELRKLLLAEIIGIINKQGIIRHCRNGLWIRAEHIREFRGGRIAECGCKHILMNGIGICNAGDRNVNIILSANGIIEFLYQVIERRIRLPSVYMPKCNFNH